MFMFKGLNLTKEIEFNDENINSLHATSNNVRSVRLIY